MESCSGSLYDKIVFNFDTEEAGYIDVEGGKLVLTVPDIVYTILDANSFYSVNDLNLDDIGITAFCTEIYHKTLSFNASEETEPFYYLFFLLQTADIYFKTHLV